MIIAFLVHVDRFRLLSSNFFLFPGVVPPRGGNGKHCSIEQWLNYSIFINPSLKGKLVVLMCYCLHVKLNYCKLEILT